MIEVAKYGLEPLQKDGEFILYRGKSADGHPQVLVLSFAGYPSSESLKRLENEYSLREELDPAWAARPIRVAAYGDRTALLLQDPGGIPLNRLIDPTPDAPCLAKTAADEWENKSAKSDASRRPLETALFLRVAISVSKAIGALHKRGIIHKDIKPGNILADSATGQCWLTGFGIASRLPRQRQSPGAPEFIAGTLPYMAPEQTGRMNRSIDSRSDLYALGVVLYEMLTGTLPFSATDPMEWVHCHIARQPVPPDIRSETVPASLSAIVMKLLAKTAEERYQTAAGLESDLRCCLDEWQGSRPRDPFPLGKHDTPDRLRIPEKLYGREQEINTLLAAFDRIIANGRPELVLVSGYSGIGKSSVVNELHKVLVPPRGLFASGKFDQYKRNIPYATLAQAFQSLVRPLLAKSEAELCRWRDALCEALGPNGLLMVDLVPELKLIIGEQQAVPDLLPRDAKARFQLVFRRFVGVFARSEHPLAIFLDDLQWLDAATMDFLQDLLTQADVHHLMLIGAYRDNEVDSTHPLWRKLDAIRKAGVRLHEIVLAPLTPKDLGLLLVDTLHCEPQRVTPLAQVVNEKTAGNPFFAIQFISALADEELLIFNHGAGRWSWDVGRIHGKGYTDNVVDLMVGKLNRLPVETQKALQEFACLGNRAAISTLSIVHGTSEEKLTSDLWEAERLEFIVRSEGFYWFLHDRVQEAAYLQIPAELRPAAHLRIGRLLARHTPVEKREEAIFEIVNQLDRGVALIASDEEREQLAELNLIAGQRAKASTAYASALKYLTIGAALLPEDAWERRHALIFPLELLRAECEFLTGELAAAEDRLAMLSTRTAKTVERAAVACLRMDVYTTLDQSGSALAVGLGYLRDLGIDWSPHPTQEDARREYERIWSQLGGRAIEELIDLPLMNDPASLATLDVLIKLWPPALFTDINFFSLTICQAINLSLERGNSDGSCAAYVRLGGIAGALFGDYQAAFRFGRLGCDLMEQRGIKRFEARTYMMFGSLVLPWTRHMATGRDSIRRAFEDGSKAGDLTYAAYSCAHLNTNMLAAGDRLVEVQLEAEHGLAFAEQMRFGLVFDVIATQIALVRMLRGLTPRFGSFDDEQFGEIQIARRLSSNPNLVYAECCYWIRKLQAFFLAGDCGAAVDASLQAQRLLWTLTSALEMAEYHFYSALTRAASCQAVSVDGDGPTSSRPTERQQHLEALAAHHKQLEVWAEHCPENFENRAALVGAEIARVEGRVLEAMDLYEQAIRSARANGFIQNEALAAELASRFYAERGFDLIAQSYLRKARAGYVAWGATGKVRQLDELYPRLREEEPVSGPTSTIRTPVEHLDLATVIKVSQAVSGEIVLEKLIDTLIRIAVEHAGAERGLLILPRGDELRSVAEATTNGETIVVRLRAAPARNASAAADVDGSVAEATVPESIVHYVMRTGESVILDDASVQNPFSTDKYIGRQHARSILCLPLIKQARLIGLLYLENKLAPHVFTPKRIAVLKLLASQAAICLENTRLYSELEQREAKIRRLVDANIIGIFIWNLQGEIVEANEAFLRMVGYSREELISGRLRWTDLTPADWYHRDERAVAELEATGIVQPFEKEYFRKDGLRVPVLIGAAFFEGSENEGVAYVLDLSELKRAEDERKLAQDALHQAQVELARVSRIMTVEQLTTSITHEVNQPLGAVLTSGNACLNWLSATPPNLPKARAAVERMMRDGNRASDILKRVRALVKKAPLVRSPLNVNEVVREVLALVEGELHRRNVDVSTELGSELPSVIADFVQLQQVVLNLVMNAIESMASITDRPRVLRIQSRLHDLSGQSAVLVAVWDSGIGLSADEIARVFKAFYSTKPQGMGVGLWICRSIIDAHGGQLTAHPNDDFGVTFQFFLPASAEESA